MLSKEERGKLAHYVVDGMDYKDLFRFAYNTLIAVYEKDPELEEADWLDMVEDEDK